MFPTRKRIIHLHLGGKVIRTTADHPLYVRGKGWVNAGDMPERHCGRVAFAAVAVYPAWMHRTIRTVDRI